MPHTVSAVIPFRKSEPEERFSLRYSLAEHAEAIPRRRSTTELVNFCHRMALAYLHVKAANGHFDASRFGLTINDVAYDAIADVFQRDASGCFVVIRSFVERSALLRKCLTKRCLQNAEDW